PSTDTSKIQNALNTYAAHFQNEKVFIQLDKTIYKPTEAVWFNVFVRNNYNFMPSISEIVYVELIAPNGKTLKTLTLLAKDGMAAGDFQLRDGYNGGLYKLKAYTRWQRNTGDYFEKTLQIQKTVLPKLNMKLEFARKAYGAGDEVVADLKLDNIMNEPLANSEFDFTVSLAGQQILTEKAITDENGKTEIKFLLPKDLTTNDGLLNVLIPHNGSTESIARTIPIVLNKIDVQFLPEGGDLVANVQSNVAFKAINEFGQPADIEGEIYNSKNEKVANFSSYHQGMGSFLILAKADEKYTAKITKPVGISESYVLPLAKANTANLNIIEQTKDKIIVRLASNVAANYVLTLTAREKIFFTRVLDNLNGEKTIEISTNDLPIGIAQLTLFSANQPVAERLAFVNPHQQLNIDIETDKENYRLRETVKAKIKVTDENGNPVKGQFSVSVVDETLLTHADDKQANILAYFLLTSDLKGEIKEPNFYFEPTEADDRVDRKKALDYVLLTHGWRRFGWEKMLAGNFSRFGYQIETTKFQGQVVDAFDQPLANAKVIVEGSKRWKDATYETTTDRYGRFVLNKVGLLPPFTLKASYEKESERKEIVSYNQNCRIKLMANYVRDIHGRVVDYRSRGLKKAKIEITGKKMPTLKTTSDKDGNWVIPNINLRKYTDVTMRFGDEEAKHLRLSYYANGRTVLFQTQ
ncbi:MAG: MG2 domain-containing protein, partial [Saprospiraceae bacterium]